MLESKYTELIAKKLSNEIDSAEEEALNDWIGLSDENRELYRQYCLLWKDLSIKRRSKNADQVFIGISAAMQEEIQDTAAFPAKNKIYWVIGIAATLILLISFVFIFNGLQNSEDASLPREVSVIEKSLPSGQKSKIFLPDGSVVWLNAESSIRYPERFDEHNRVVHLSGEAYFDVTEDPLSPFVVKTGELDITVLGTTFNVRNYRSEGKTDVSLESGKVLIHTQGADEKKYLLAPGEGLSLDNTSGRVSKFDIDPKSSFYWKDGIIYFKEASFEEVINKLSRWYGVEFLVENYNNEHWEYSAEFKNDYLNNILESMGYTKGFQYRIDQNIVRIMFN